VLCSAGISCSRLSDSDYLQGYVDANNLIDSYKGRGEALEQAAQIVTELGDKRPDLPHSYVARARLGMYGIHVDRGWFAEFFGADDSPEYLLKEALSADPKFCDAQAYLGHVYYKQERYAESLQALDEAEQLSCSNEWRSVYRADAELIRQHFDQADTYLARVPAVDRSASESERNRYVRALGISINIAFWRGDRERMRQGIAQQLALISEGDAWGLANAASSQVQTGDFDDAIANARKALDLMEFGAAKESLGTALFGSWLWRNSHGQGNLEEDARIWSEAESFITFKDALQKLWISLANRDLAYRYLLQQRVEDDRAQQHSAGTGKSAK
jgi:tetratricopeptide (TPR) repeat protein